MEDLLSAPREILSHQCEPKKYCKSQIKFCRVCSLFLGNSSACFEDNLNQDLENAKRETKKKHSRYYRTSSHQSPHRIKIDHEKNLQNMLKKQHKNRFYNQEASHLVVRPKIIDFMTKIHEKFGKGSEILHKAVVLMDSVFSRHQVSFDKIELIVLLCLHLSSKFDESFSNYDPEKSFFKYAQRSYSFNDIIHLEKQLVRILEFQFDVQSPFHFLNFFNSNGVVSNRDINDLVRVYSALSTGLSPDSPAPPRASQKMSFLVERLHSRAEQVDFRLNGSKNRAVAVRFSQHDIGQFLAIFGRINLFENKEKLPSNFKTKFNVNQTPNPLKKPMFADLDECYSNPIWPLFIEFMFRGFGSPSENQMVPGHFLADKSRLFTEENIKNVEQCLLQIIQNLPQTTQNTKIKSFFAKDTKIDLEYQKPELPGPDSAEHNLNIESFLSQKSLKELSNRTSILCEHKLPLKSNPDSPESPDRILLEEPGQAFSVELSDLDFSEFSFTISSNTQTMMRLLNCLRLNCEGLPVGLVEVCCSNFESIFKIILRASIEVYSLNKFTSVAVAVSILYISRKLMNFSEVWTPDLALLTGLSETDIEGCVEHVLNDPSMFKLVSDIKRSFESESQETVFGTKKIFSFRNILRMYHSKAQKVVHDFRRFERIVKNHVLLDFCLKGEFLQKLVSMRPQVEGPSPSQFEPSKLKMSEFETNSEFSRAETPDGSLFRMFQFEIEKENVSS